MHDNHITKSILSITSPGTNLIPGNIKEVVKRTREFNTELAEICKQHPTELSFFASLPLPDIKGSIQEIDFALDVLNAKGFAVLSNVNGIYPGDARLDAI